MKYQLRISSLLDRILLEYSIVIVHRNNVIRITSSLDVDRLMSAFAHDIPVLGMNTD